MIIKTYIRLSQKHDYYLEVQGQLTICNKKYTDFVCWTPHGMHVERIIRNVAALNAIRPSLDAFFRDMLLSRLLRGPSSDKTKTPHSRISNVTSTTGSKRYCWCQQEEHGRMIACDNNDCVREWFHFECVGLTRKPRGKWYCCDIYIDSFCILKKKLWYIYSEKKSYIIDNNYILKH